MDHWPVMVAFAPVEMRPEVVFARQVLVVLKGASSWCYLDIAASRRRATELYISCKAILGSNGSFLFSSI
jgi:hypothetical protein